MHSSRYHNITCYAMPIPRKTVNCLISFPAFETRQSLYFVPISSALSRKNYLIRWVYIKSGKCKIYTEKKKRMLI